MEHTHQSSETGNIGRAFKIGIALNLLFIALEVVAGFFSNSMALLADAGHNLSDVMALVFSWVAIRLSLRKPTLRFTYGLRRSTIMIALLNTMLLLAAVTVIIWETIKRLGSPREIDAGIVTAVALVAIVVNGFTAWLFVKGQKHDLNIRSAFLHFIADALVSLGVVVAGIIMTLTGLTWVDSVVSFVIIGVILYSSYGLLKDSVSLSLDAVPENIDIESVRRYLEELPQVSGLHDLHIWALSTSTAALTVHLETAERTEVNFILQIQQTLHERFGIDHSTVQVEYGGNGEQCSYCN